MSLPRTAPSIVKPLVTLSGEFFDAQYEEAGHAGVDRDGTLYYFKVADLAKGRGTRSVSLFISGPDRIFIEDYDARIEVVRLNRLRQAFDSGEFTFETPVRSGYYHELHLRSEDFQRREHVNDEVIRKFVKLAGYCLGFCLRPDVPNFFIDFDCAEDLDYLGVTKEDLARNLWLMREQDYFTATFGSLKVTPTRKLIEEMENPPAIEDEDRKFARMAIDEARKSVSESGERPHPKVGAVVVKNGQVLSTAHRGEATGNHAEFLALEKKLSDAAVAGATVYTTLEPCTTRNHPKIPCAERLIDRRVAGVVIGMLDPDDRISGKGQRKLRKAGIITDLFPHDLAMEVEELNWEFTRFCEQNLQTEVGPANKELWKEVAGLRAEIAELKQSVETREKERSEFENLPVSFKFDQGSPGNYSGHFQNDSRYKVSIETIRILRGDTDYESPLTEAVKPRKTDNWTFERVEGRTIFWGPQYDPISMVKSLVQSPKPRFPDGEVIPIAIELTLAVGGRPLTRRFVRQVLVQGDQILTWGP